MLLPAVRQAVRMLNPVVMMRNPVMFVTEVGAAVVTAFTVRMAATGQGEIRYSVILTLVLWITVLLANFAEALAEARGKAQAASLRKVRTDVAAYRYDPKSGALQGSCSAAELRKNDIVRVEAAQTIPADGEVIEGVASVDESAVTGDSAPVIRESGGDRSAVTGGTRVLSDWLVIRVTADPGESFLDRMISMVEGANRQKTPNEIALTIVLAGFTLAFFMVCVSLYPIGGYFGIRTDVPTLVALLVCLIPTTIGALLPAIGIAGMARLARKNVLATSGRAVEAAGDVDVLLLDKTGTITFGNRQASDFIPAAGVAAEDLADAAQLASLADETPEGRSIVVLAKKCHGIRGRDMKQMRGSFIPFSAQSRMSGVDLPDRQIRKGAAEAVERWVRQQGAAFPEEVRRVVEQVARSGGTPLAVASNQRVLGVIHLKDVVKGGIRERFAELRRMGIKTVMITGDNRMTATAIAAEAGVDDFLSEATPETKLQLIRGYQADGHLVAMTGDGTNDAPALAQADVAVAMNSGTQAAKEASNMVDLDSSPAKLIDVVEVGKQMLMTRGALTTFSIANDVAKYFAILPAIFVTALPHLAALNAMGLGTPRSAILSAVIFNAVVIPCLIPIALRGVKYRAVESTRLLRDNLLVYGLGGIIVPFIGIKLIDLVLNGLGAA